MRKTRRGAFRLTDKKLLLKLEKLEKLEEEGEDLEEKKAPPSSPSQHSQPPTSPSSQSSSTQHYSSFQINNSPFEKSKGEGWIGEDILEKNMLSPFSSRGSRTARERIHNKNNSNTSPYDSTSYVDSSFKKKGLKTSRRNNDNLVSSETRSLFLQPFYIPINSSKKKKRAKKRAMEATLSFCKR